MSAVADALALARQCYRSGDFAAAEQFCRRALAEEPADGGALALLGALSLAGQRYGEAVDHLQRAAALLPHSWPVHANLGIALAGAGKATDAEASFRRAVQIEPNNAELWTRLGTLLLRLDEPKQAAAACARALLLRPDFAAAHVNRGIALARLRQWADSAAHLREAVRFEPNNVPALDQLGRTLLELDAFEEAATILRRALEIDPGRVALHTSLGVALLHLNRLDEAVAAFDHGIEHQPDDPEAHFYRGFVLLAQGDYERGWTECAWRWKCKEFVPRSFRQPLWDGSSLVGRTILLHAEQGMGDTLQFIRYARLVKERGGTVLFECPRSLLPLLRGCAGIDRFVPPGEPLPDFGVHAALLDLPGIFRTTLASVPADTPYLTADPTLVEAWRRELAGAPGFRVGIVWRGKPGTHYDRYRSAPLRVFEKLAHVSGVRLVSLQKGAGVGEIAGVAQSFSVLDFGDRLDEEHGTLMDTAAVVKSLDLVITVDTAVAHLAGGLGVPFWVVLPFAADWRWLRQREDSPWYPTARLFRQTRPGDWPGVFERVEQALRDRAVQ